MFACLTLVCFALFSIGCQSAPVYVGCYKDCENQRNNDPATSVSNCCDMCHSQSHPYAVLRGKSFVGGFNCACRKRNICNLVDDDKCDIDDDAGYKVGSSVDGIISLYKADQERTTAKNKDVQRSLISHLTARYSRPLPDGTSTTVITLMARSLIECARQCGIQQENVCDGFAVSTQGQHICQLVYTSNTKSKLISSIDYNFYSVDKN